MNKIFNNGDKTFTVEYWNSGELTGTAKYQCVFRVVAGNTNANRVVIVSPDYNIEMSFDTSELEVDGITVTDATDAFEKLKEFVSLDFSGAGGSAIPTFQSNNAYKNGEAIFYNDVIWVAKADFVSGDSFDAADWDKFSISVSEFEDGLDEKVDKTGDTDKIYGTDGAGEQTTFDKSDFEIVANKTTDIRDADHADDEKYPTELAVRTHLNGVFDSIMADMNTAVSGINTAIDHIANDVIGDLDGVANSTDKSTVVAALNSLFKLLNAGVAVEIKSDGLYITRDDGSGTPTEDRFAELTDLEPLLQEIQGLHGKTARLNGYDFGMGITADNIDEGDIQTMLSAYALTQLGLSDESEIPNFIGVHNLYDGEGGNHLLVFNEAIVGTGTPDSPEFPAHWVDNGLDSVSTASNTTLGVVKGSTTDMKVAVESDGSMSVNGLSDALNEKVAKIHNVPYGLYGTNDAAQETVWNMKSIIPIIDIKVDGISILPTPNPSRTVNIDLSGKVDKTGDTDKIYGTDGAGEQTTYDKDTFGKVDTVNGISPDANKNVQTNYVYNTEEEFEADKDNIPVGATVIKLYEYPDNTAGFMVVPDYSNIESINRINTSTETWTADRTGFVFVGSNVNAQEGFSHGFFRINNKKTYEFYFESQYGGGGTVLPIRKGDTVSMHIRHETYSPEPMRSCYFIPSKFIEKELPVVVEKNGSYSLDEVKTAETWIDGKPIYKRTVAPNIMILANQNTNIPASWVSNIDFLIDNQIVAVDSEGSHRTTGKALEIIVDIKNSAITISSSSSRNMTLYGVTLFYTKIAD